MVCRGRQLLIVFQTRHRALAVEFDVEPLPVVVEWARTVGFEDYVLSEVPVPDDLAKLLEPSPSPEEDALMKDLSPSDDDVPLFSSAKSDKKRRVVSSESEDSGVDSSDSKSRTADEELVLVPVRRGRFKAFVQVPASTLPVRATGKSREVEAVDEESDVQKLVDGPVDDDDSANQESVEQETVLEDSLVDQAKYPWVAGLVREYFRFGFGGETNEIVVLFVLRVSWP